MLSYFGIKKSLLLNFLISLVGIALMIVFWNNIDFLVYFIFLAKFGVSASFNIIFVSYVQLLPSVYNTSAFSYSNMIARLFTVLAPVVANMKFPVPMVSAMFFLTSASLGNFLFSEEIPKFV